MISRPAVVDDLLQCPACGVHLSIDVLHLRSPSVTTVSSIVISRNYLSHVTYPHLMCGFSENRHYRSESQSAREVPTRNRTCESRTIVSIYNLPIEHAILLTLEFFSLLTSSACIAMRTNYWFWREVTVVYLGRGLFSRITPHQNQRLALLQGPNHCHEICR